MPCFQNACYQDALLPKCLLPKCPITETSYYRNVQLPKCPVTEMYCYGNGCYQNVHYQSVLYQNVWIPKKIPCSGTYLVSQNVHPPTNQSRSQIRTNPGLDESGTTTPVFSNDHIYKYMFYNYGTIYEFLSTMFSGKWRRNFVSYDIFINAILETVSYDKNIRKYGVHILVSDDNAIGTVTFS